MSRYSNIPVINNPKENKGTKFYSTPIYPRIPLSENDLYVLTNSGDRLDLLADQFYGDSSLWWIISSANEDLPQNSLNFPVGTQLRIPQSPTPALNSFNQINNV